MTQVQRIILPHGTKTCLRRELGCSASAVNDALNMVTQTNLAKAIRDKALKDYGGKVTTIKIG